MGVFDYPFFLIGEAEADEEDVGGASAYALADVGVCFGIQRLVEVAVVRAADAKAGNLCF